MPVKKGKGGERYVEAEVEVPGSPESVWQAIATGKGISSWFVPSTIDGRDGGSAVSNFGPGMEAVATIKAWNPPHDYVVESEGGPGKVATEWIVEARAGGTCIVRVVHRWFADSDDWDGEFEGHAYGWAASFFRMLRLYLTHYAGQQCAVNQLSAFSKTSGPETWRAIRSAMRIDEQANRVTSTAGAPGFAGTIESTAMTDPELLQARERSPLIAAALEGMDGEEPELLVRLDQPAPGLAHFFIMPMGDVTMVSIRFFLYGEMGAAAANDVQSAWSAWLDDRFPQEEVSTC